MDVGSLDQQIQLQQYTQQNVGGENVEGFTDGDLVWGTVITEHGGEAFEAARTNARAVIRVGIHYRDDVTTTWKLSWETNTYNIVAVDRSARRDGMLWLTAQAVGAI